VVALFVRVIGARYPTQEDTQGHGMVSIKGLENEESHTFVQGADLRVKWSKELLFASLEGMSV